MATFRDALQDDEEVQTPDPGEAPEEGGESAGDGTTEADDAFRALLTGEGGESDDDDADPDVDELLDPDAEKGPEWYQKRLGAYTKKAREAERKAAELQGRLDGIAERYQNYKDPLAQARGDADFMDSLETLTQDPKVGDEVRRLAQIVAEYQETGRTPQMPEGNSPPAKTPAKPQRDPEVQELLRETASQKVGAALEGASRLAIREATEHILESEERPSKLSKAEIQRRAAKYFKAQGYTEEDIFPTKSSRKGGNKPPTRSARAPATRTQDKPSKGEEGAEEKGYSSIHEAREKRGRELRTFLDQRLSG